LVRGSQPATAETMTDRSRYRRLGSLLRQTNTLAGTVAPRHWLQVITLDFAFHESVTTTEFSRRHYRNQQIASPTAAGTTDMDWGSEEAQIQARITATRRVQLTIVTAVLGRVTQLGVVVPVVGHLDPVA